MSGLASSGVRVVPSYQFQSYEPSVIAEGVVSYV